MLCFTGADDDDVVINAFKTFDQNGKIDGERYDRGIKISMEVFHLALWAVTIAKSIKYNSYFLHFSLLSQSLVPMMFHCVRSKPDLLC